MIAPPPSTALSLYSCEYNDIPPRHNASVVPAGDNVDGETIASMVD